MSDVSSVPCGLIQESALNPILFPVVEDSMLRRMRLSSVAFANDIKFVANMAVRTTEDVQAEVDTIAAWSDDHDMPLSIDKCIVLRSKRGQPQHPYYIKGAMIKSAVSMKHLGIMRSAGYGYEGQCQAIAAKANRIAGMIRHSFQQNPRNYFGQLFSITWHQHCYTTRQLGIHISPRMVYEAFEWAGRTGVQ